jgi:hypothetical protein
VWRDAEQLLAALNDGSADAAQSGDPLLLEQEYQMLAPQEIERLFGRAFASDVLESPLERWSGPIESGYGLHLVSVHDKTPSRMPELDEVRDAVTLEWRAARVEEANRAFYEGLRAGYEVTVESPIERPAAMAERQ